MFSRVDSLSTGWDEAAAFIGRSFAAGDFSGALSLVLVLSGLAFFAEIGVSAAAMFSVVTSEVALGASFRPAGLPCVVTGSSFAPAVAVPTVSSEGRVSCVASCGRGPRLR